MMLRPDDSTQKISLFDSMRQIWRIAMPLMISMGTFSLVLFADRTLLLQYDGASMSASMAGGNLFWVMICLPIGIASMTSAMISQYIGSGQSEKVGSFLWQAIWTSLGFTPWFALIAWHAPWLFQVTGQPESLIDFETTYLRLLMTGAVAVMIETALSGFFSGTQRTRVIMWVSIVAGLLNLVLDGLLIFGLGPFPELGIAGAAIASVISFWFKAVCYAVMLFRQDDEIVYGIRKGFGWDRAILTKFVFFGFPAGLMNLTESGGFTVMLLRIGTLGDIPLRATTMAINFNMIAFIPLVGVSVAASVLVGRHLTETGPELAIRSVYAALAIGLIYSGSWMIAYMTLGDTMMAFYTLSSQDPGSTEAIRIATGLLSFVAIYVVLDAVQLILAGSLRGAGDTWFVLLAGAVAAAVALGVGFGWEPETKKLHWWWSILTFWICLLTILMALRFAQGRWQSIRMVEPTPP